MIYRVQEQLCIDEVVGLVEGGDNGDGGMGALGAGAAAPVNDQLQALAIQVQQVKQGQSIMHSQLEASIGSLRIWCGQQFNLVNSNVRRFGGTIQGAC